MANKPESLTKFTAAGLFRICTCFPFHPVLLTLKPEPNPRQIYEEKIDKRTQKSEFLENKMESSENQSFPFLIFFTNRNAHTTV